jgi:hypothetical protein
MIKKYNQFLNEEIYLRYEKDFEDFLTQDNSDISNYLLINKNQEVEVAFTNLKIDSESDNLLSFNPEDKKAPKNIYLVNKIDLSRSINLNYKQFGIFFLSKVEVGEFIYPIQLPNDWKIPTKVELVRIYKMVGKPIYMGGTYDDLSISEIEISELDKLVPDDENQYFFITKDESNVYYIFGKMEFEMLKKIDFKENRIEKGGIGRLVNKILQATNGDFTSKELEDFVNRYKSYKKWLDGDIQLEVVSGDKIREWYDGDKYSKGGGGLNNSCMRHDECQEFFSIYTQNPEVCQMLILLNYDRTKIDGRALLWTLINGKKVMDRIYTTQDQFENIFIKWAGENGYLLKMDLLRNGGGSIQLKRGDYHPYPFMDTFCYYNINKYQISTHTNPGSIILNDTDGEYIICEFCEGTGTISCDECGGCGSFRDDEGEDITCERCDGSGIIDCPECF